MLENAVDKCMKGGLEEGICVPSKRSPEREPPPGARPQAPFPRVTPPAPKWTANEELEAALVCKQETLGTSSGRVYTGTSLFCLTPSNQPRKTAIRIVESRPFDPIILLTIAVRHLLGKGAMTYAQLR